MEDGGEGEGLRVDGVDGGGGGMAFVLGTKGLCFVYVIACLVRAL